MPFSSTRLRAPVAAALLGLACAVAPSLASNVNYYYDPNGRLIATTRIQGLNENYAYDQADNRTRIDTGHQNTPNVAGQMNVNQGLTRYQSLSDPDNNYFVTVQNDGNVVLYKNNGGALWGTGTVGQQTASFGLQGDGNLVARDAYGNGIWSSGTSGHPNAVLQVQTNGNMALYDGSTVIWQTNTAQP